MKVITKGLLLTGACVLMAASSAIAGPSNYTGDANTWHIDGDKDAAASLAYQYIEKDIDLTIPRSVTLWWTDAAEGDGGVAKGLEYDGNVRFHEDTHQWGATAPAWATPKGLTDSSFKVNANCRIDLWVFGSDLAISPTKTIISDHSPSGHAWDAIEDALHPYGLPKIVVGYTLAKGSETPVAMTRASAGAFDSYIMLDDGAAGVEFNKGVQTFTVGINPVLAPDVIHAGVYTGKVKVVVMTP